MKYHSGVQLQGDPSAVPYAVQSVQELLGQKPMFGICMGHQLLGQAFGGKTFKLKFGHHGGNHPVRHNASGVPPSCRVHLRESHIHRAAPDL